MALNDMTSELRSTNTAMRRQFPRQHKNLTDQQKGRLKKALSLPIKRQGGTVLPSQSAPTPLGGGNS